MPYVGSEVSAKVTVAKYTVELDPLPTYAVQGDTVTFTGRVLLDTTPVAGTRVEIYLEETRIAACATGSDGRFSIPWVAEYGLVCDAYQFWAVHVESGAMSPTRSMAISYRTRISVSAPSSVRAGEPFTVSGRLEYEYSAPGDWRPLVGKVVSIYYDGTKLADATTGSDGSYSATVTIPSPGNYTIRAVFAGEMPMAVSVAVRGVTVEGVVEEIVSTAPLIVAFASLLLPVVVIVYNEVVKARG